MDLLEINAGIKKSILIQLGSINLEGLLHIPENAKGLVIFSHGSGSSRNSLRNNYVANVLQDQNIGTLLIDLLTKQEEEVYETRFDIDLLTKRLNGITNWFLEHAEFSNLNIGFFGASTGAAAALNVSAEMGDLIKAVVCRGGRPDLALNKLYRIKAPVLLIVGGNDLEVLKLNQKAYQKINSKKRIDIIPGSGHLFEEANALDSVAELTCEWFKKYLEN